MMNLSASSSNTRHKNLAWISVAAMGVLLILPGCGIPKLRRAKPGPPLPPQFSCANNLEYLSEDARASGFDEGIVLASFSQNADWVSLKHAAVSDDQATTTTCFMKPASWISLDPIPDAAEQTADSGGPATYADEAPAMNGGFPFMEDGAVSWENSSHVPWNVFFNDPILTGLINQALVGNQELRILAEEIRIANFEVLARRGEYLPFVTLGAGAGIDKPGEFTRAGAVEEQLEIRPGKGFPEPLPDFLVAADLTWEIDIWRKLRNARDAAALRYLGTRDGQNYVVTRLVSEIAENYYELLALDNRLITLDQTIAIQEESLKIAEAKKAAARGTELPVQRFLAIVRRNESEKLIVHQQIIETENRINFLLGRFPQYVQRDSEGFLNLRLPALSAGVPSQLLQNRADIRQAERELEAAGLDVQVARARFYPSLALTAGVGYQAFNPRYLFSTPESLIYNVAGDLVAPLINKKAIQADYLSANATQLQAVYNYQRTILNAFTEVINRMAKVENYGRSIEIKKTQLDALEKSVDVATSLFQNAQVEYVEVLLAQRDLMEARMVLIETKQQQLSAVVMAYQALGGGAVLLGDFQPPQQL